MDEPPLQLRRATEREHSVVVELIDTARAWLRTIGTDQWEEPWPDEETRNARIRGAIQAGRTWIAWDGTRPAATITASPYDHEIWPEENRRDPAVYIRRLVVSRQYSGQGLGAQLLDWAGLRANSEYAARWIRVEAWTTNKALHAYYLGQGFEFCGFCETVTDYPSAALFQKRTNRITRTSSPLFHEAPEHA